MPFVPGPACPRLEHQNEQPFPTDLIPYEEGARHVRRLTRMPCGCMRYGGYTTRPKARVRFAAGVTREMPAARLMAMLSRDRPLGPKDFATHCCDNPVCANPDHLLIGTASSNGLDKYRPDRPIRERLLARFFDPVLEQVPDEPAGLILPRKQGRPLGYDPRSEPIFTFPSGGLIGAAPAPALVGV